MEEPALMRICPNRDEMSDLLKGLMAVAQRRNRRHGDGKDPT